jgi:hypothetical protein
MFSELEGALEGVVVAAGDVLPDKVRLVKVTSIPRHRH